MKTLLAILLAALTFTSATAQTDSIRKKNRSLVGIAAGASNILDTYLSPEDYKGFEIRLMFATLRKNKKWSHLFQNELSVSYDKNRRKDGSEIGGMYRFRYGLFRNIPICQNFDIRVGGQAALNLGFLYNTRNQNNPAQGRLGLHVGPMAQADYTFRLFNRPFALHYEASAPLVGLMFSPNYGQSYYEIFSRGNYDHNCVPTTIASTPSFRQMLTLDFNIRRSTFTIGYLGDYDQYKVNNLKYHNYTHSVILGYRY
ncbi:MAG: DUF3316 domain-containing protein [Bacteroidaceae bacterium]|nr:DUF3316 domain-containing protein [Bacteroidaceae bacterium]